ncbi:COG4315 family predicted lipoprotein [Streptomyces sp. 8L]|uniref:COG4315 family predicted lipoprotein n=1 Tax=Streptomyces sp. 8L TaxID=2877242 RepID=UPI001CD4E87D|nr:hypothetical protein [Streptomyces sp. 8L]MCA1221684.1 hypothetical protein [Streptomyces sp. 8L]
MKNTAVRAAAVVAAALFATTATACSNSGSSSHHKGDTGAHVKAAAEQEATASPSSSMSPGMKDAAAKIMTSNVPGLGEILVDSKGHTLYVFEKDTTDKSTCTGACAQAWPPAIVTAKPQAGTGSSSASPSVSASVTGSASPSPSPSVSASPSPTGGMVQASLLGTTKRSDGTLQATYNKHPLYYFALDKQPGQTGGQGVNAFGAKWFVVGPKGAPVTAKAPKSSASPTGSSTATTSTGGTQY